MKIICWICSTEMEIKYEQGEDLVVIPCQACVEDASADAWDEGLDQGRMEACDEAYERGYKDGYDEGMQDYGNQGTV